MQKSLFENEMLNTPPKPLFLIARVSGSFSSITYKQAVDFLLPRHYSGRKPSITFSFGFTCRKINVLVFVEKSIAKRYLN